MLPEVHQDDLAGCLAAWLLKPRDTPTPISPRPGITSMWDQDHRVQTFYMGSGDHPQVLTLVWQMTH